MAVLGVNIDRLRTSVVRLLDPVGKELTPTQRTATIGIVVGAIKRLDLELPTAQEVLDILTPPMRAMLDEETNARLTQFEAELAAAPPKPDVIEEEQVIVPAIKPDVVVARRGGRGKKPNPNSGRQKILRTIQSLQRAEQPLGLTQKEIRTGLTAAGIDIKYVPSHIASFKQYGQLIHDDESGRYRLSKRQIAEFAEQDAKAAAREAQPA